MDVVHSFSHDLPTIANTVSDIQLQKDAAQLQEILGDANRMYYPAPKSHGRIPHDEFTMGKAGLCMNLAENILSNAQEFVDRKTCFK